MESPTESSVSEQKQEQSHEVEQIVEYELDLDRKPKSGSYANLDGAGTKFGILNSSNIENGKCYHLSFPTTLREIDEEALVVDPSYGQFNVICHATSLFVEHINDVKLNEDPFVASLQLPRVMPVISFQTSERRSGINILKGSKHIGTSEAYDGTLQETLDAERRITRRNIIKWSFQLFTAVMRLHDNYMTIGDISMCDIFLESDVRLISEFRQLREILESVDPQHMTNQKLEDDGNRNAWLSIHQNMFGAIKTFNKNKQKRQCAYFHKLRSFDASREGVVTIEKRDPLFRSVLQEYADWAANFQQDMQCLGVIILQLVTHQVFNARDKNDLFLQLNANNKANSALASSMDDASDDEASMGLLDEEPVVAETTAKAKRERPHEEVVLVSLFPILLKMPRKLKDLICYCLKPSEKVHQSRVENAAYKVYTLELALYGKLRELRQDFEDYMLDFFEVTVDMDDPNEPVWTAEDERMRIKAQDRRRKELKKQINNGVTTAARRVEEGKYRLWYSQQSDVWKAEQERRRRALIQSEKNDKRRRYYERMARLHWWTNEDFREWAEDALRTYFFSIYDMRTANANGGNKRKSSPAPAVHIQQHLKSVFNVLFQKSIVQKLLNRYDPSLDEILAAGVVVAKTKGRYQAADGNFWIKLGLEDKQLVCMAILAREFAGFLLADSVLPGRNSTAMKLCQFMRKAIEEQGGLTEDRIEKDKLLVISDEQFTDKKLTTRASFVSKFFNKPLRTAAIMVSEEISTLDRDWTKQLVLTVSFSACKLFHLWKNNIIVGENLASERISAFFRMIRTRKIMRRIWNLTMEAYRNKYGEHDPVQLVKDDHVHTIVNEKELSERKYFAPVCFVVEPALTSSYNIGMKVSLLACLGASAVAMDISKEKRKPTLEEIGGLDKFVWKAYILPEKKVKLSEFTLPVLAAASSNQEQEAHEQEAREQEFSRAGSRNLDTRKDTMVTKVLLIPSLPPKVEKTFDSVMRDASLAAVGGSVLRPLELTMHQTSCQLQTATPSSEKYDFVRVEYSIKLSGLPPNTAHDIQIVMNRPLSESLVSKNQAFFQHYYHDICKEYNIEWDPLIKSITRVERNFIHAGLDWETKNIVMLEKGEKALNIFLGGAMITLPSKPGIMTIQLRNIQYSTIWFGRGSLPPIVDGESDSMNDSMKAAHSLQPQILLHYKFPHPTLLNVSVDNQNTAVGNFLCHLNLSWARCPNDSKINTAYEVQRRVLLIRGGEASRPLVDGKEETQSLLFAGEWISLLNDAGAHRLKSRSFSDRVDFSLEGSESVYAQAINYVRTGMVDLISHNFPSEASSSGLSTAMVDVGVTIHVEYRCRVVNSCGKSKMHNCISWKGLDGSNQVHRSLYVASVFVDPASVAEKGYKRKAKNPHIIKQLIAANATEESNVDWREAEDWDEEHWLQALTKTCPL